MVCPSAPGYAGDANAHTTMPFLSPMGRYAVASKTERKRIDTLNKLYYDKLEDKEFQQVRDEMLDAGNLEPDQE